MCAGQCARDLHIPFDCRREPSMHACVNGSGGSVMADEIDGKIIQGFAADVVVRLNEAAVIARMADDFGKQGLIDRAFHSLLEIEPLMHEALALVQASSIVRRRHRSSEPD